MVQRREVGKRGRAHPLAVLTVMALALAGLAVVAPHPGPAEAFCDVGAPDCPGADDPGPVGCTDRTSWGDQVDRDAGPKLHVIYAVPKDMPERTQLARPLIENDVMRMSAVLTARAPHPRLNLDFLANMPLNEPCLDITTMVLPRNKSQYRSAVDVAIDIDTYHSVSRDKKYLVYIADWNTSHSGQAVAVPSKWTVVNLAQLERTPLGDVTMHETLHMLGAASPLGGPEHGTGGFHVSDDPGDVMYADPLDRSYDTNHIDQDNHDYWNVHAYTDAHSRLINDVLDDNMFDNPATPDTSPPAPSDPLLASLTVERRHSLKSCMVVNVDDVDCTVYHLNIAPFDDNRAVASYSVSLTQLTRGDGGGPIGAPFEWTRLLRDSIGQVLLDKDKKPIRTPDSFVSSFTGRATASDATPRDATTLRTGANYRAVVRAKDGSGNVSPPLTVDVHVPTAIPTITYPAIHLAAPGRVPDTAPVTPARYVYSGYRYGFQSYPVVGAPCPDAASGPDRCPVPPGFKIDPATGVISGMATRALRPYTYHVNVYLDGTLVARTTVDIDVGGGPLTSFSYLTPVPGTIDSFTSTYETCVNEDVDVKPNATRGTARYAIASGKLPIGLYVDLDTGEIKGSVYTLGAATRATIRQEQPEVWWDNLQAEVSFKPRPTC
ncbi:MAG: hypothetical protein JWM05_2617 [Acidimicrobiales bacterium]|nr:hypothetical protein [Acidimicrobiales bacterium]